MDTSLPRIRIRAGVLQEGEDNEVDSYYTLMGPHFIHCLESCNVPEVVSKLKTRLEEGNEKAAFKLVKNMEQWLQGLYASPQTMWLNKKKEEAEHRNRAEKEIEFLENLHKLEDPRCSAQS